MPEEYIIETDVLVIGGGIAGCYAAAKARDHGLEVTLVEKAKTDRSGCSKCYDLCPMDVIDWNEETNMPVVEYDEDCWFCGVCWFECPKRAIEITYPASFW